MKTFIQLDVQNLFFSAKDINRRIDFKKLRDNFEDTEEYYDVEDGDAGVMMDDEVVVVGSTTSKKNLIECSASILLPFSEDVAFDAFSDLTRQP